MQNTPLYSALLNYRDKNMSRFHTPGHAGKGLLPFGDFLGLDATEIEGLDSLYTASGVIAEAEGLASDFFGSAQTLFSAGGCTLAIQTMLSLAAAESGKSKIVVARNAHASVIHTCALLRLDPVFVYPRGESGEILARDIEVALDDSVGAVLITSPNYYGVISDISAISALCRRHGVLLLCDNAHGAHLTFFGLHPLTLGADMTACSAHKTLPVLTGGAFLNLASYHENAKYYMSLFGSTSPSYPVLASLDIARACAADKGKADFLKLKTRIEQIKEYARTCGLGVLPGDPVRLTLDTGRYGKTAGDILRKHGVEPEFCDDRYAVLIATPFHTEEDFTRIERAISEMPFGAALPFEWIEAKRATALFEAIMRASEWVDVCDAAGRIAAGMVSPCPPGIPILTPGEEISRDVAEILKKSGIIHIKVIK